MLEKFPLRNIKPEEFDGFQLHKAKHEGTLEIYNVRKGMLGKKKSVITKSSVGHYHVKPALNSNIPKL